MRSNNSNVSSALWGRRLMALWAVLAIGLGAMASTAEAAPFTYVTNQGSNNVSVIDTATNAVVVTVPVGNNPYGVAGTPDGKHVYVTNSDSNNVSVIDTATNTVMATIPVGDIPYGVAGTPDGKHVYVTNSDSNNVSVIDTATNTVMATIPVGDIPYLVMRCRWFSRRPFCVGNALASKCFGVGNRVRGQDGRGLIVACAISSGG
jgi:YVTN family beta-propeller protein